MMFLLQVHPANQLKDSILQTMLLSTKPEYWPAWKSEIQLILLSSLHHTYIFPEVLLYKYWPCQTLLVSL